MRRLIKLEFIEQLDRNLKLNNNLLQVIVSPRQVGKTTTCLDYMERAHSKRFHYVSADTVFNATPEWIVSQWQVAAQEQKILVIDEIQKCENWSETIKMLWDQFRFEKKSLKCILLGSSSLQIQKGLSEELDRTFSAYKGFSLELS